MLIKVFEKQEKAMVALQQEQISLSKLTLMTAALAGLGILGASTIPFVGLTVSSLMLIASAHVWLEKLVIQAKKTNPIRNM